MQTIQTVQKASFPNYYFHVNFSEVKNKNFNRLQCSFGEQQLLNFMQVTDLKSLFQGERTDIAGRVLNVFFGELFYFTSESQEHLAERIQG